jgi:hypothetical protein
MCINTKEAPSASVNLFASTNIDWQRGEKEIATAIVSKG